MSVLQNIKLFLNSYPNRVSAEMGSNIENLKTKLPIFGTSGLISLGLIFAGFVLALVFEKKLGWILVLGGIGFLLHLLGFF